MVSEKSKRLGEILAQAKHQQEVESSKQATSLQKEGGREGLNLSFEIQDKLDWASSRELVIAKILVASLSPYANVNGIREQLRPLALEMALREIIECAEIQDEIGYSRDARLARALQWLQLIDNKGKGVNISLAIDLTATGVKGSECGIWDC